MKAMKFFCQFAPLAAASILLFAACQDALRTLEPANVVPGGSGGKASVTIAFNAGAGRTVLPQVSLADVSKCTLLGGKSGAAAAQLAEFSNAAGAQVLLEPGTWSFTLNAYNSANALILQGTAQNRSISLAGNNTVTFSLLPLEREQGTISITVDCPAIIAQVSAAVDGGAESGTKITLTATAGGKRTVYADTKSAGSYFVVLRFYDEDDMLRGTVSELVLVRGSVTSTKMLALAEGDLKAVVPRNSFFVANNTEFADALSGIQGNTTDVHFTITVTTDFTLAPQSLSGAGYEGKTITVKGDTAARTITLNSNGSLFTVGADVALEVEGITLAGKTGNNAPLVKVTMGGKLAMKNSGKITGNETVDGYGGGVYVNGGTLEIAGGEISGNTASSSSAYSYGGGVYMENAGSLIMTSGSIRGNTASCSVSGALSRAYGGGLCLQSGRLVMSGGTINGNTVSSALMSSGGGVFVGSNGNFEMHGGIISGNTASSYAPFGGGVCVDQEGSFAKAPESSGNSGIIYGSEASGTDAEGDPLKNAVTGSTPLGAAVFYATDVSDKQRNTTLGETDSLSTVSNVGWE